MVSEIMKAQCHIQFDEDALDLWNIPITAIQRVPVPTAREASDSTLRDEGSERGVGQDMSDKDEYHASLAREANASTSTDTPVHNGAGALSLFPPTEEPLYAMEAEQKMGNAFKKNAFWWILELVPTYHESQNEQDEWVGRWR